MELWLYLSFGKFVAFDSNHYSVSLQPSATFKWLVCLFVCFLGVYVHAHSLLAMLFPGMELRLSGRAAKAHQLHSYASSQFWLNSDFFKTVDNKLYHFSFSKYSQKFFCLSLLKHRFCKIIQLCLITSFHYFRSVPRKA